MLPTWDMTASSSPGDVSSVTSARLDMVVRALADKRRCLVVRYFLSKNDDVASVDDLVLYIMNHSEKSVPKSG